MQERFSSAAKVSLPKKIMPLRGLDASCQSDQRSENRIKLESEYSDIP